MLSAASRRAGAAASKPLRFHAHPLTRSLSNAPRPTTFQSTLNGRTITQTPAFLPRLTQFSRLQTRHLTFSQRMRLGFREASKGIWRKNPVVLPLAILSTVVAVAAFAYIAYVEVTVVGPQYRKFPPAVEDQLRTAVYYTDVELNPAKAVEAYRQALRKAAEEGMHPYSDEVLGIKVQTAKMLEMAGLVKQAVDVLERTKDDSLRYIEKSRANTANLEKKKTQKKTTQEGDNKPGGIQITDPEVLATEERMRKLEELEIRRQDKVLKKVVGMQMKLAELYSTDHMQDEPKSRNALEAAVELSLKEMNRRAQLGLPVGTATSDADDAWLNQSEIAACLEQLGSKYLLLANYDFSLTLYARALELLRSDEGPVPTPKQAVLLGNISHVVWEMSRQTLQGDEQKQGIQKARDFSLKSLELATRLKPENRDETSDYCLCVTRHNLGEFAEFEGKFDEAAKWYREALDWMKETGVEDGVELATTALERVTKKSRENSTDRK